MQLVGDDQAIEQHTQPSLDLVTIPSDESSQADDIDLVEFGIAGVQRFIAESTTTADVANASMIIQQLASSAARIVADMLPNPVDDLIFPYLPVKESKNVVEGVSSKIVFKTTAGSGPEVAAAAETAVNEAWDTMVRQYFKSNPPTPGFPDIWWVAVTGTAANYSDLWKDLRRLVTARRRSRVFTPPAPATATWLSAHSPLLPAVAAPTNRLIRAHEKQDRLSTQGWVKRLHGRHPGQAAVRSTWSIATTPYRVALLSDPPVGLADAVDQLASCVATTTGVNRNRLVTETAVGPTVEELEPLASQLGAWVSPQVWQPERLSREYGPSASPQAVSEGYKTARRIAVLAQQRKVISPSAWFAVVMQDIDQLGHALGALGAQDQRQASRLLVGLAAAQRSAIVDDRFPGVAVYTGGDDVLALCPATSALELARRLRKLIDEHLADSVLRSASGMPITASSSVVFASAEMPLQIVLEQARAALTEAKTAHGHQRQNRDAIAMVGLTSGGVRVMSVQPWSGDPTKSVESLRPDRAVLSASLASQLETDRTELEELAAQPHLRETLKAELARLIRRRNGDPTHAGVLMQLAGDERCKDATTNRRSQFRPVPAVVLARFLAQKVG